MVYLSRSVCEVDIELLSKSSDGVSVLRRVDVLQLVEALKRLQLALLGR